MEMEMEMESVRTDAESSGKGAAATAGEAGNRWWLVGAAGLAVSWLSWAPPS